MEALQPETESVAKELSGIVKSVSVLPHKTKGSLVSSLSTSLDLQKALKKLGKGLKDFDSVIEKIADALPSPGSDVKKTTNGEKLGWSLIWALLLNHQDGQLALVKNLLGERPCWRIGIDAGKQKLVDLVQKCADVSADVASKKDSTQSDVMAATDDSPAPMEVQLVHDLLDLFDKRVERSEARRLFPLVQRIANEIDLKPLRGDVLEMIQERLMTKLGSPRATRTAISLGDEGENGIENMDTRARLKLHAERRVKMLKRLFQAVAVKKNKHFTIVPRSFIQYGGSKEFAGDEAAHSSLVTNMKWKEKGERSERFAELGEIRKLWVLLNHTVPIQSSLNQRYDKNLEGKIDEGGRLSALLTDVSHEKTPEVEGFNKACQWLREYMKALDSTEVAVSSYKKAHLDALTDLKLVELSEAARREDIQFGVREASDFWEIYSKPKKAPAKDATGQPSESAKTSATRNGVSDSEATDALED